MSNEGHEDFATATDVNDGGSGQKQRKSKESAGRRSDERR
jgi:hypothetical protein